MHVSDGGGLLLCTCVRVCLVCVCVCVCVCAWCACVRACVRACVCYRVILSLQHVKEQLPLPNVPQAVGGELPAAAIAPAAVPVPAPV